MASVSTQPPYFLLSGPKHSTSSSQPRFIAWLHLGISKSSTSSSHLWLLYSSGRCPGQNIGDLALYHSGNPRASTPSRQLQTTSEQDHPTPAQLILHGGQSVVVSDHSQSLQLNGLGKSLPLTCQQQPRLNYKRRVYSTHMKYPAWVIEEAVPLDPTGHLLH